MVVKLHAVNRRHLSISCNIREVSKPKRLFFGDADRLTLRILQLFAQGQPIGQPGAREKCPCHLWGFSSVCIFSRPPQGFQNFEVIQETKTPKRHVTKVALKTKKQKKRFQKLTSQTSTGHRGTKKAGTAKFSVDLELPQSVQQRGSMAKKSQVCTGR